MATATLLMLPSPPPSQQTPQPCIAAVSAVAAAAAAAAAVAAVGSGDAAAESLVCTAAAAAASSSAGRPMAPMPIDLDDDPATLAPQTHPAMPALASLRLSSGRLAWSQPPQSTTPSTAAPSSPAALSSSSSLSLATVVTVSLSAPLVLTISYLRHSRLAPANSPLVIQSLSFRATAPREAAEWLDRLRKITGLDKERKVLVIINPASGDGSAQTVYERDFAPVLESTGVFNIEVLLTEKPLKLMWTLRNREDLLSFDAIVACGGDGLLHEIVNGILTRSDWDKASRIPILPIPLGVTNLRSRSLKITHPLVSLLLLTHISETRRDVPVVGLTTSSGLRVFAHSCVRWTPPPPPARQLTKWANLASLLSTSWCWLQGAVAPTFTGSSQRRRSSTTANPNVGAPSGVPDFMMHYCALSFKMNEPSAPTGPVMRNQPGPPLRYPCMAPSTLPISWRTVCCGGSNSNNGVGIHSGLDVRVTVVDDVPLLCVTNLASGSEPKSPHRPRRRAPSSSSSYNRARSLSSRPARNSESDDTTDLSAPDHIETKAMLVALAEPPAPPPHQTVQAASISKAPNGVRRYRPPQSPASAAAAAARAVCLAGGELTVDGQPFEFGPFAAEVVSSCAGGPAAQTSASTNSAAAAAAATAAAAVAPAGAGMVMMFEPTPEMIEEMSLDSATLGSDSEDDGDDDLDIDHHAGTNGVWTTLISGSKTSAASSRRRDGRNAAVLGLGLVATATVVGVAAAVIGARWWWWSNK